MPSEEHELLAEMFRVRPELALDVLEELDFPIPEYEEAVVASAELNNVVPTEFRADQVVTYRAGKRAVFAVIVEVQLRDDKRKRFSWPAYVGTLYSRLECPLLLVVVCPDTKTAAWCRMPVVITDPGFFRMAPVVMGPRQVPVITDVARAERNPELTLLSTLMHRDEPAPRLRFEAAAAAINKILKTTGVLYYEPILAVLSQARRSLLEEIVTTVGYRNEFLRHHEALGEARGEVRGEARTLLKFLDARKIHVPDDVRARISSCTDEGQLDKWVRRAATADKVDDLFD